MPCSIIEDLPKEAWPEKGNTHSGVKYGQHKFLCDPSDTRPCKVNLSFLILFICALSFAYCILLGNKTFLSFGHSHFMFSLVFRVATGESKYGKSIQLHIP